jgi:hypothetical protein
MTNGGWPTWRSPAFDTNSSSDRRSQASSSITTVANRPGNKPTRRFGISTEIEAHHGLLCARTGGRNSRLLLAQARRYEQICDEALDSDFTERQSCALRFAGNSCFLWRTIRRGSYSTRNIIGQALHELFRDARGSWRQAWNDIYLGRQLHYGI